MISKLVVQPRCDVKFYMTKGDMFKSDQDMAKCMCQITQTLSASIPPMHGFEMPLIYLPNEANNYRRSKALPTNHLGELTDIIQKKL